MKEEGKAIRWPRLVQIPPHSSTLQSTDPSYSRMTSKQPPTPTSVTDAELSLDGLIINDPSPSVNIRLGQACTKVMKSLHDSSLRDSAEWGTAAKWFQALSQGSSCDWDGKHNGLPTLRELDKVCSQDPQLVPYVEVIQGRLPEIQVC